jgi:hypothetical protein
MLRWSMMRTGRIGVAKVPTTPHIATLDVVTPVGGAVVSTRPCLDHAQPGDLVPSDDWISAASWVAIVVTQAVATLYEWTPQILVDIVRRRAPKRAFWTTPW